MDSSTHKGQHATGQVPPTVSENIETVTAYYARQERELSLHQSLLEHCSNFFASPAYVVAILVFILAWIGLNLAAPLFHRVQFDQPPFFWLQGIITLNAFIMSATVLIRQRRMAEQAELHAHIDLQVNLLTEKKTSKIIEQLEQLRRDLPNVKNKCDPEADLLQVPADTEAVMSALDAETRKP